MATVEQCRTSLETLAERLTELDGDLRRKHLPNRTLACTLLDLDVTFHGYLRDGHLTGITTADHPRPDIRLVCSSDDLVAMVDGELAFAHAWGTGRLRLDAGWRDLIRLRAVAAARRVR